MVTLRLPRVRERRPVATGRLMLERLPHVGDEVRLNGRTHVVRAVDFGGGEHVLELEPAANTAA